MDKLPLDSFSTTPPEEPVRRTSWAFQLALCLLGPLFFVSYALTLLAPLPSLYLHVGTPDLRRGRLWSFLAVAIGAALSFSVKGWEWSVLFFLFVSLPALVLGELLMRRAGPERAVIGAVLAVLVATGLTGWIEAKSRGEQLLPALRVAAEQFVREAADSALQKEKADLPEATSEEIKSLKENPAELVNQLPGFAALLLVLLCALPCVALIRWNPKGFLRRTGIARDYLRRWRTPFWLVWPTLLCWGLALYDIPVASDLAGNLLKPLLLIYFFQGMSILAFFLDSLRLRGPIRLFFYGTAILFMWQVVLSFGLIDVWASFREGGWRKYLKGGSSGDQNRRD
jgi:hypothetical protein